MIGSILIPLIMYNQPKLVQRFLLNSLLPVADPQGSVLGPLLLFLLYVNDLYM